VVLLDLVMPGMPDAEALEGFRELDPTVPHCRGEWQSRRRFVRPVVS
jgi:DNA-binding NarL/FixJ family response regulator